MNRQRNRSVPSPSPCEDEWNCFFFFVRLSHRSLTKQHRGRCSKCLKRSTKSCTRGEARGLASSGGCRRSVSSGPLASLIFGTLPNFPTNLFDFSPGVVVCVFACACFVRIVGTQVVRPGDEGFQWFATSGKSSLQSDTSAARGGRTWSPQRDKGSRE